MKTTTAALRSGLLSVLTAAALGGAATVNVAAPEAAGAPDPCAASEMARTIGSVARSAGDYLDSHPDTNQAMTSVLQQPAGPDSVNSLKTYFAANPRAAGDLQTIAQPLVGLSTRCKLPISIPQALGFVQNAQGGGLPGVPGGPPAGAPAQPVAGAPGSGPGAGAGTPPAAPVPNPAAPPVTAVR